jgi:hypothetical protein
MYQVGFRFAPKLHGILTKAQAVLQLFSLLAKRLMHYQVGLAMNLYFYGLICAGLLSQEKKYENAGLMCCRLNSQSFMPSRPYSSWCFI